MEPEDRDLVEKFLRRRDESSFRLLYRRHTPTIYALAIRLLGGASQDAEDVVQETWLRATQGLSEFRWESSFRTWLCGITINCSRNLRARQSASNITLPDNIIALQNRSAADLEQLIYRLPNGYREVFVLHDIEGYTHQEISRHLGIHEGTSKSQLFEARKWLRSRLEWKKTQGGSHGR